MPKSSSASTHFKYRSAPARTKKSTARTESLERSISSNDHFNILEILLLDHSYLKDCIDVLKDNFEETKIKLKYAKCFLDALEKHSLGEKKALYTPLQEVMSLRSRVLESVIEHGIIDDKVRKLSKRIRNVKTLNEELNAELKVLAELVGNHIEEEEDELFPIMRKDIDSAILNQMGHQFLILRQFTEKDLQSSPDLQDELSNISKTAIPVKNFMSLTHEYFSREY